jgi:hypothetical protein
MSIAADNSPVQGVLFRALSSMSRFEIHQHLPPRQPISDRWHILALGIAAIYTISYLVHIPPPAGYRRDAKHPSAQMCCYALFPLALVAPMWFWLTVDLAGGACASPVTR